MVKVELLRTAKDQIELFLDKASAGEVGVDLGRKIVIQHAALMD